MGSGVVGWRGREDLLVYKVHTFGLQRVLAANTIMSLFERDEFWPYRLDEVFVNCEEGVQYSGCEKINRVYPLSLAIQTVAASYIRLSPASSLEND